MNRLSRSTWALVGAGFVALWLPVAPAVADAGASGSSEHANTTSADSNHDAVQHRPVARSVRSAAGKPADEKADTKPVRQPSADNAKVRRRVVSKAPAPGAAAPAGPATQSVQTAPATLPQPVTTTTPTKTPLVNVVGSVMFNVIGAVMQVIAGAPTVPAGSTVSAKQSSLTMPDTGQTVKADWYFPKNADSATRIVYFQHGFMAVAPMYSHTLAALAEQTDSIIVAPTLSSNAFDVKAQWLGGSADQQAVADLFAGSRSALTASAAAAGYAGTLPLKFVLLGHSLGGALVTSAAGRMVGNGAVANLQGVVLMDSVDLNNVVPTALAKLTGADYRPVYDISSEPYVWNVNGLVGRELQAARPGQFNGVMLTGGRHIDGMVGANPLLQYAEYLVAGFSLPQNIAAERQLAIGWINDMFAGTHDGSYGSPQQAIEIPTTAGKATAVVLPFTSDTPVQATPWDGIAQWILDTVLQYAVYQPLSQSASVTDTEV